MLSFPSIFYDTCIWKESLNSDGEQFHQYQQNEPSPLTFKLYSLNTNKKTTRYKVGNLGHDLGQAQKYVVVKLVTMIPSLQSCTNKR